MSFLDVKSQKKAKNGAEQSLEEILQSISDLEVGIMNSSSNESICQTYRSKLCEVLTKLLLSQTSETSLKYGIAVKLWNQCFYTRINQFRERIAKELRREERAGTAASASGTQRGSSPLLPEVEHIFKVFLNESIKMYGSLIYKFKSSEHCKLPTARKDAAEIIYKDPSCLIMHSLYLRHGDLHRYTMNFQEAEKSYQQAIELLPGLGEAYNHVGVMCQQKDQRFFSLYFYARSLLASVQPFAVSYNNLLRLFADSSPCNDKTYVLNSKDKNDKQAAKKKFLAGYVDLNRRFFSFIFDLRDVYSSSMENYVEEEMEKLVNAIDTLLKNLHFLLKQQYLGEGVLLKMIAINIFTVVYLDKYILGKKCMTSQGCSSLGQEKIRCLPSMALNFAYRFGIVVTGQLRQRVQVLKKAFGGARSNASNQSLRLLPAIQLLCDWLFYTDTARRLANNGVQYVSEKAATVAYTEQRNFYSSISLAWSDLMETNERAAALGTGFIELSDDGAEKVTFKEYFPLRGFAPFSAVVSQEDQKGWLSLNPEYELQVRIDHIFQYIKAGCGKDKLNRSIARCEVESSGLKLATERKFEAEETPPLADGIAPSSKSEDDDDVDDIVVYQAPSSKALNLPSRPVILGDVTTEIPPTNDLRMVALLQNRQPDNELERSLINDYTAPSVFVHVNPIQKPSARFTSVCRPPPGFAPSGLRVPQSADSSYARLLKTEPCNPFEIISPSENNANTNSEFPSAGSFASIPPDDIGGGALISRFDSSLFVSNRQFQNGDDELTACNSLDLKGICRSTVEWQKSSDVSASIVDFSEGLPFPAVTARQHSRLPAANSELSKPNLVFRLGSASPQFQE